jgi:GNAT superfamily N-acetyltransferase
VQSFDCGNRSLDDFLNSEEVANYEDEGLGVTTLVYHRGNLVGYYTTSFSELTVDYVKSYKSFSKIQELRVRDIPSVKIGRLAVQRPWQRKGFGRLLVRHIAGEALAQRSSYGVRLMILNAEPDSIEFYEKIGFQITDEVGKERKRRQRTMFFDLWAIKDIA